MPFPKWLPLWITVAVAVPLVTVALFGLRRPVTLSELPADEQSAIKSIEALQINVSTSDYFSFDFRTRGRAFLSRDTDDRHCHVVGFEVLQSCAAPVGPNQLKNLVLESTQRKLVGELIKCRYLQHVVVPDASPATIARLRRELQGCFVSSSFADSKSESAKVIIDAINRTY